MAFPPGMGEQAELRYRSPLDAKGFTILHNAVLLDQRLSDGAKVTYLVLLWHARQEGSCWPGEERLAQERGLKTDRAIRNHLAELETVRLITRQRRGKQLTNLIWIEPLEATYTAATLPASLPLLPPESDRKDISYHPTDRKKSAGQKTGDRKINAGPLLGSEEDAVVFNNQQETFNVPTEGDKNNFPEAIQRIVTLTKDGKSARRFKQLHDLCVANRALSVWTEALMSTERRLKREDLEPVDRPGAYFCSAVITLLGERGITVPTGTKQEREEVRGLIGASLNAAAEGKS